MGLDKHTFYGTEDTSMVTYLEFGEMDIARGKKRVWDFRLHQTAYDWFMLGRYANDILSYQDLEQALGEKPTEQIIADYNHNIHHKDDATLNLRKLVGLAVCRKPDRKPSFYELGQTLFGCIDGMAFLQRFLRQNNVPWSEIDLTEADWYGVDISAMFNRLSERMHQDYRVLATDDPGKVPPQIDLFYARGISLLYRIRSVGELFRTVGRGRLALFDYSFSTRGGEDTTIGSGKTVRYLDCDAFLSALEAQDRVMYVQTASSKCLPETGRIWLDCLYGDKDLCDAYVDLDRQVRAALIHALAGVDGAEAFCQDESAYRWVPAADFVHSNERRHG